MSEHEKKEEQQESPESEEPEGENFWEVSSKRGEEKPAIILLREIAKIMDEMDLSEVSYEEENIKLSLKRGLTMLPPQQQTLPQLPAPQDGVFGSIESSAGTGELVIISTEIPGIFYRAPQPGAEPHVKVGDIVNEGDTLCVIEAMKHFNEIKAEFDCEIVEIMAEDAESVEYDAPLFKVRRIS